MGAYAMVGELLLSDGTTYTRLAIYDAADMRAALRLAVAVVERWRGEQIAARPHATVRDVIEVQISEDHPASLRQSDGPQDQQESEQCQEEPPRLPRQQVGTLRVGGIMFGEGTVGIVMHRYCSYWIDANNPCPYKP
jgi:hypothetical protein